jgi:hypothetical protein
MPIKGRWRRFTRENLEKLPTKEGAYELANAKKSIIRIGSSKNLRRRLITHLIGGGLPTVRYFRCDIIGFWDWDTGTDREARHAKKFSQAHARKPKYSKRLPH